MRTGRYPTLLFMALLIAGNTVLAAPAAWPIDWHVERYRDHPLAGRIWTPAAQTFVAPETLRAAVGKARFVLLGETHDNPDHHRLQAQLLDAMVKADRHPAVAFEMLDLSQQQALTEFLRAEPDDAAGLGPAVDWAASGWPDWSNYEPIADVALANHLAIVAANLPAKTVKAVAFKGYDALDPDRVAALGLREPLAPSSRKAMLEQLYVGHCKLMPKSALAGMVHAQRTRNAVMASRLLEAAGPDGAVLITGAGHARTDYGVPLRLRTRAPRATIVSVALVEVRPDKLEPSDYAPDYHAERLPFDYVLFTPAAERKDPCVQLRKKFERTGDEE